MARTTLDIDDPVLKEVRVLQQKEGRSLGKVVSELLAEALAGRTRGSPQAQLRWISQPMRALVDLADKEALYAILDRDES